MALAPITHPLLTRAGVRHGFFTRKGGASSGIFAGLNCGAGSSDQADIVAINRQRVAEAMEVPLRNLTDAIRGVLEQTPPELSADIIDKGIVLSGGGALLRNIDRLITNVTGVAAHVAPDPLSCVAKGTGIALEHFDVFAKSLTSQA